MVASGLNDRLSVSQYRLAFHLTLACVIYAALLWAAQAIVKAGANAASDVRKSARGLMILVLLQIYLGALVAGLDAGLTFNTWPLIDGTFIPPAQRLFFLDPPWVNFFENALTVQFDHRMMAYVLWSAAILHVFQTRREPGMGARGALWLAVAMTIQAVIGIVTLLHQAILPLALLHQAMAMIVLTIAVIHAQSLSGREAS
jgi:cytochrome c oxidase assembly protein subunit 15